MRPMLGRVRLCGRQGMAEREGVEPCPWSARRSPEVSARGVPGGSLVIARGGMGGTWPRSTIETPSDFCGKTAGRIHHNILWYAECDRGISRGFSLEEL